MTLIELSMELNFNHLYYFLIIAQAGSVTAASKQLHVTQPTLSGQLRQLEEALQCKLFDRQHKRLVLNKNGERALSYALQIFKLRDSLMENFRDTSEAVTTHIGVGVIPSFDNVHLHEFLEQLWSIPNTNVCVKDGTITTLLHDLKIGVLDVVLCDQQVPMGTHHLGSNHLFARKMVAVASPEWKKDRREFPRSLTGRPFINVSPHSGFREEIDMYFHSEGVQPVVRGEVDDLLSLLYAAESGRFFTILPEHVARQSVAQKKLVILGHVGSITSDMWAVTRKGGFTPRAIFDTISHFSNKKPQSFRVALPKPKKVKSTLSQSTS